MSGFLTPAAAAQSEALVKKSRFIAFIAPARSRDQALAFVDGIGGKFKDARHVCWAYIIGEPGSTTQVACNDDGEPAGTAGKPILNVLQQNGVGDAVAVVVRYFGGIKLGAGGLVRAYSNAASAALEAATLKTQVQYISAVLELSYSLENLARHCLQGYDATINECHYNEQLCISISIAEAEWAELRETLKERSNGDIRGKLADHT